MQLRLETLQKIRMNIGECTVELKDKDYLIEAYEILNDVERNISFIYLAEITKNRVYRKSWKNACYYF